MQQDLPAEHPGWRVTSGESEINGLWPEDPCLIMIKTLPQRGTPRTGARAVAP